MDEYLIQLSVFNVLGGGGGLLMLQLLRPDFPNLPCLYLTFHLEYPSILSRFCFSQINWQKFEDENEESVEKEDANLKKSLVPLESLP